MTRFNLKLHVLFGCAALFCYSCSKGPSPFTDFPPLFNMEREEFLHTLAYIPTPNLNRPEPEPEEVPCFFEGIDFHGYEIRVSFSRFKPYGKPYSLVVNFPSDYAPEPAVAEMIISRIHKGRFGSMGEKEDFKLPGLGGFKYSRVTGSSVLGKTARFEIVYKRIKVHSIPLTSSISLRQMGY